MKSIKWIGQVLSKFDLAIARTLERLAGYFTELCTSETWLKLFGLLLVATGFSVFTFSIGIKLFYRHPLVLFGIWILLEQFDDFVQLPPRCILKDIQLCLYKYLKRWVLYPIIAYAKQIKMQDVALTRIRLLLKMEAVVK